MKMVALNARIPAGLKKAVDKFCEARGLKVQSFIENLMYSYRMRFLIDV